MSLTRPAQEAPRMPVLQASTLPGAEPRVLFLTHTGRVGGAEVCLLNLAPAFMGQVFMFADGPLRARFQTLGVSVRQARRGPDLAIVKRDRSLLRAIPALSGMARLIREIVPLARVHDVLYCTTQKSFVLGALSSFLVRRPLIWHLHDILTAAHFGRQQIRLVVALANARAARVVVPSRAAANSFAAAGGRAKLAVVVPNGTDLAVPADELADREALRHRLGLPGGFLFGVFSRLSPWKGQHVAIEALAHLSSASCLIVGDALFGEQAYAASLHALASRLGVAQRVHFLGYREDIPLLMGAVDVLVHPSVDPEPFGMTLIEAMLCGTPVIASNTGAAPEILDNGAAGCLVPPGNPQALAEALSRSQENPGAAHAQLAVAGQRVRTLYALEPMRRQIAAIIRTAAAAAGGASA